MKKISLAIILIGTIGLAINMIFGMNTITFITKVRVSDTLFAYKFDTWNYIQNIRDSFNDVSILTLTLPTRQWDTDSSIAAIVNNLAFLANYVLLIINVLLYPFKIGGYLMKNILAFIGINVVDQAGAGGMQWLVDFSKALTNFTIPYI